MEVTLCREPELLNSKDLERLLRLSAGRVRIHLREGTLPGVKIGARWYVPRCELEKFLSDQLEVKNAKN